MKNNTTTLNSHEAILSSDIKNLVVFVHGYGANGSNLINLAYEFVDALPNAAFISPDAPFPYEQDQDSGRQWFSLLNRDERVIYNELKKVEDIFNSYLDEQLKRFALKDENLTLIGFSQGTMLSLHSGLRRKNPIKTIIGYSGVLVNPVALDTEMLSKPKICLIHGKEDEVIPHEFSSFSYRELKKRDIPVELHKINGLNHGIDATGVRIGKEILL